MAGCERRRESLVCPRPRRLGDSVRPLRWHPNNHSDMTDLRAGTELLDIILSKGSGIDRSGNQVASSPPFFCGSPPSRVSNPVVHDENFGSGNFNPFTNVPTLPSSPSSSARKGGCSRMKFGQKPAAVRIEGFDCLARDRQNCSISAVA
uniref:Uncharacterized protein n=1 Tax=Opuntia streptacantha TaxID=393608 RepID=A0A7C9DP10_OPUST